MYRRHLLSIGTLGQADYGLCCAPADGASGGGAVADAADGAGAGDGSDAGADGGAGDGDPTAGAGAEDNDADPFDTADLADHLPEANVRTQLRRSQRFAHRARPIVDRFRDANGKFLPMDHVDRIIQNAREFEPIDRVLRASPRALEVLLEEQRKLDGGASIDAAAAAQDVDQPFDESRHPFETETEQGKYLLELSKRNHLNEQRLARLERGVGAIQQHSSQQTLTQLNEQWKGATLTAAKELPEGVRSIFIRGVRREFDRLNAAGQLTRASAQQVIDAELKDFRAANPRRPAAATPQTTRQSAMVAGNQGLPRVPRPGSTSPATTAAAPNPSETIRDGKASFYRRVGRQG